MADQTIIPLPTEDDLARGEASQRMADAGAEGAALSKATEMALRVRNLQKVAQQFNEDPGWVIPGMLPAAARFVMVTGPSKAGKTWLAHSLVLSLGNGRPWLGLFPLTHKVQAEDEPFDWLGRPNMVTVPGAGRPQRTLYLQAENSEWSMESRTRALLTELGAERHIENGNPVLGYRRDAEGGLVPHVTAENVDLLLDPGLDLTQPGDVGALTALVADGGYENVVLDSAYAFVPGSLNDEVLAKALVASLKSVWAETGCRVIVIHHSSTKGDARWSRSGKESMGSTFFTSAWYDLELRVSPREDDQSVLVTPIARDAGGTLPARVKMTAAGRWETVDEATEAAASSEAYDLLLPWMEENGVRVYEAGSNAYRFTKSWTQAGVAEALGVEKLAVKGAMRMAFVAQADDDEG